MTKLASRNESLGFAHRTLKNLDRIEQARAVNEDVHVVTQRVVSLLGVVVFPWTQGLDSRIQTLTLAELATEGWPQWRVVQGSADTLGDLLGHLRNAVAHRRISFSSDSREPEQVDIEFADARGKKAQPYWRARIRGDELEVFLRKFLRLVDDTIG